MKQSAESLDLYRLLKSDHGMVSMMATLGLALLERGDTGQACQVLQEGLILSQPIGNKRYIAVCLQGLAGVTAARGNWTQATRLLGAMEELCAVNNVGLPPVDRARNERSMALVRDRLGPDAFVGEMGAGRMLSLEGAVAEALDESTYLSGQHMYQ